MTTRDIAPPAQIQIRELNYLALGDAETPVHARRLCELSRILALTTGSWIHRLIIIVGIIRSARRQRKILARTSAWIQKPARPQAPPSLQIVRPALTLRVRAVRAATVRPLAPTNSQPAQIFNHGASKFRPRASRIQILVPQNQSSPILGRPLRRDAEGPRVANMQQPRRRRRQASAITSARTSRGRTRRGMKRDVVHKGIFHKNILA